MPYKLREILDKYESWGYNDFEIIKKYFQENHYEHQAIDMMMQFSKDTIKNQHTYVDTLKDLYSYSSAILYNEKIDFKIRMKLVNFYHEFLRYGELSGASLREIDGIFENIKQGDINFFPQCFIGYLQTKGIAKIFSDADGFRVEIIEKAGQL